MTSPATITHADAQGDAVDSPEVARELARLQEARPEPDLGGVERGLVGLVALVVAAAVAGATDAAPLIVAGALIAAPVAALSLLR